MNLIDNINPENLVDITSIEIDTDLPKEKKMRTFIEQIGNPYLFKCGKIVVQIGFTETEITLDERMETYLKTI
jgi:hypothetical protein